MYKFFRDVVTALQSTSSKNEKVEILKQVERDSQADLILRFLFDDNITTGIKRTKLNKYLGKTINSDTSKYAGGWPELLEYFQEHTTGKEEDINYLVNSAKFAKGYLGQGESDLILSVICKDLKLGCGATTYNKAHPDNPVFHYDIMAGKSWEEERARKLIKAGNTLYFTEKIDGNRGTLDQYTRDKLVSRNGKEWSGVEDIVDELNIVLGESNRIPDGELVYHDPTGLMTSQEIRSKTSAIMGDKSITNKAEAGIVFKIFDLPLQDDFNDENEGETYTRRREMMEYLADDIKGYGFKYVQVIPVEFTISSEDELPTVMPRLKEFIDKGKEGYMCIASSQPYKMGKGYQMMKLKNILSADLIISGWNYGKEKTKWEGKFASFTVDFPYVDKNGKKGIYQVDVGTGYSDEFREAVDINPDAYIGKMIEILVTEVSKNKNGGYSLSYARLVEVRNDKNTIDLEGHTLVELDGEMYFKSNKEV